MAGLLGRVELAADEGLLLPDCRSVHTVGMRFAIDAVFLDGEMRVRRVAAEMRPWRLAGSWSAAQTLEIAAGAAERLAIRPGKPLCLVPAACHGELANA
jgi:uncharacterized protein